jgi:putative glycosyl hydrolase-like family 15 (GHL15) protein
MVMGDLVQRRRSLRHVATALAALACLLASPATASALASETGQVRFLRNATSEFDPYLTGSTSAQQQWMRDHYSRMRGYAPFFDNHAIDWAPPAFVYRDLYAIYNSPGDDGLDLVRQHPNWVLRDPQGRPLYIDYNCSGSCPQFAADVGNPQWRQWWIDSVGADLDQGYAGLHIDDVNMEMKVSDGNGNFVRPIDPRTSQPMTEANWRRYVAEFTEQIRAAFPTTEISQNPLWWMSHADPYVRREIDAADYIQLERGFTDGGLVGGSGRWGYETYLAHVDWLHSRGQSVIYEPKALDRAGATFELASYLLVNDGGDLMDSYYRADPDNWWRGWQTDLGAAQGSRYTWKGLLRRDFTGGMALVNQPDAAARKVELPRGRAWTDLDGDRVRSVTLRGREAAVLVNAGAASPSVTLRADDRRVSRGSKVRLKGQAPGAPKVIVQTKRSGGWHAIGRSQLSSRHRYQLNVRARPSGVRRYRATAPGLRRSPVLRLRVTKR